MFAQCMHKDDFLNLMDEYPEARHFYFQRSFERRTEIRRRMFKFYQALENQHILDKIFIKGA